MDQESKKMLDDILVKSKDTLTKEDKEFLKARRSYLSDVQREHYKDVLNPKKEKPEAPKAPEKPEAPKAPEKPEAPKEEVKVEDDAEMEEVSEEEVRKELMKKTNKELQAICKDAGLAEDGTKKELVDRLIEGATK